MKFQPIGKRCLVKRLKPEEKKNGIILLNDNSNEGYAEVIEIGKDSPVKKGDIIMLPKYNGRQVTIEGEEFLFVENDDILAVKI